MPWKAVAKIPVFASMLAYIQFPWRLFSFVLLFLCMSGAAGVWLLAQEYGQWKRIAYALIMLVSFLSAMYYLNGNNGEHVLLMQTELIDSGLCRMD